jgi:hypothetical protein
MLTAYLDESGHSSDTDFFSIGGIVATSEKWEVFQQKWEAALLEDGIDRFHMREFAHSVGNYKKWEKNELERRRFLAKMFSIIEETDGRIFGAVVNLRAYRLLADYLKPAVDPYLMCFQHCIRAAGILTMFHEPVGKVAVICEEQGEFGGHASRCWLAMKDEKAEAYERMGSFIMEKKKNAAPLQAADFVAYEMRQYCSNLLIRPADGLRWGMKQLIKMSFKTHHFFWLDYLGTQNLQPPLGFTKKSAKN